MKKIFIAVAAILILLTGCIAAKPLVESAAPAPVVSEPSGPAETDGPSPDVSREPGVSPDAPAVSGEPNETADTVTPPSPPVVSNRILSYKNEHINVEAICPEVSGMLDEALQQDVNDTVYNQLKGLADNIEKTDNPNPDYTYYLQSRYMVRRNDGEFLSITISVEYYDGGANTGTEMRFINVNNAAPGQSLAIGDLFIPGADYENTINSSISAVIAADPDMSDFTFSGINGDQGFYLTDTNLVIVFGRYMIAPGVVGEPEFTIPLSELGDILIPELG